MVANYIADIQALDRQSGQIFIIKTRYSQDAAGVEAGDIVFENPTDGTYSSEFIGYTDVQATADVTANPSASLPSDATVKVRAGSFIVRLAGKEIARDYGNGSAQLDGVNSGAYNVIGRGVSGTVNAQTGVATLKLDATMYADAVPGHAGDTGVSDVRLWLP